MDVLEATRSYEAWLGRKTALHRPDLELKHARMAHSPFEFLRATFYRWAQLWPELCPELTAAPALLAVGDLHLENFGTWRDREGRLVWGINDFDEACRLPYTVDLVRLATSACLANLAGSLSLDLKSGCAALLEGYRESLETGGRAFVLAEENEWLRETACGELRDPERFWRKIRALPDVDGPIPDGALRAVESALPEPEVAYRLARRSAGLGSLGRQRYVALADWNGGHIARETKPLVPSAWGWARGAEGPQRTHYREIVSRAVRCPDPCLRPVGRWVVRRLSPDCCKIDVAGLSRERDEARLLRAMGWETANVHLGTRSAAAAVIRDLTARPAGWLEEATLRMAEATLGDWKLFRKSA